MKEFELEVIEKITSRIYVEAEDEHEAYNKAMEELNHEFETPYCVDSCVVGWEVVSERVLNE